MTEKRNIPHRGLEKVVAADTMLTYVDGQNGKLYHRGFDMDTLAGHICYEEMVYLLWFGKLPTKTELENFRSELVAQMRIPMQVIEMIKLAPPKANPMVVLRTAVSAMGMFDPDGGKNSEAANLRKAKRLVAQVATVVAFYHRISQNKPIISAGAKMSFAENFLYIFTGKQPTKLEKTVFDTTLVLHADHGLAASTFAARATVSTLAGMHSSIAAALASLKGPLHGGANTRVMEMLEDIGNLANVKSYIEGMLSDKKRIMGFGHRVYKTEDPRSHHLRKYAEKLSKNEANKKLFDISHHIEKIVLEKKGINPNVDFYSATVQRALGIPKEFYTCIFASARVAGWVAHVMEQFKDNRLIRPTSNYIGGFERKFVSIEKRS